MRLTSAGVMKDIINSGIHFLNWFSDIGAQQVQTGCYAAFRIGNFFNITLIDKLKENYAYAFQPHQVSFAPAFEIPEAKIQLALSAS